MCWQPVPGHDRRRNYPRVAVALGFRPDASTIEWLAVIGLLLLFSLALVWPATALGLAAKSVETASNTPIFLYLPPFLSSGLVPTSTMPVGLRQFAEYQPFTPVTETVRGLISGTSELETASRRPPGAPASPWPLTSGPGASTTAGPSAKATPLTHPDRAIYRRENWQFPQLIPSRMILSKHLPGP
jgi:hypothetical protein